MNKSYDSYLTAGIEQKYRNLENRIMEDVTRRIKKTGKITSSADYQLNRYHILGNSTKDIEDIVKHAVGESFPETFELYDEVINKEYTRSKALYEQVNETFIPYEQNAQLQQVTQALIQQSNDELHNITKSMGFKVDMGDGRQVFTPLSEYYNQYLDDAMVEITSGAFDYNSVLRRVVTQMTNSGLRTVDYASGMTSRCDVAARRAVMTGLTQLTGKISDTNAQKLRTEYFEIAWHGGARPRHREWQGKIWSREELVTVCGLGTAAGLEGANCYHERYPFIQGISERQWSDAWLAEQNRKEDTPKAFKGKEYTMYEATQRQRYLETNMRAQRQKVELLQKAGADPDDVMLARCKYQAQLDEYKAFSNKMGLLEQRERIYYDMRGRVAPTESKNMKKYTEEMMKNATKDTKQYEKFKEVIGNDVGSLANFRQMKYNDPKQYESLKKRVDTYEEINKKEWSPDFKKSSKEVYDRYSKEGISLSTHAISRISRLNDPKFPKVVDEDIFTMLKSKAQYLEGEEKEAFFDKSKELAVIRSKKTNDVVSIVRRKNPKKEWEENV